MLKKAAVSWETKNKAAGGFPAIHLCPVCSLLFNRPGVCEVRCIRRLFCRLGEPSPGARISMAALMQQLTSSRNVAAAARPTLAACPRLLAAKPFVAAKSAKQQQRRSVKVGCPAPLISKGLAVRGRGCGLRREERWTGLAQLVVACPRPCAARGGGGGPDCD